MDSIKRASYELENIIGDGEIVFGWDEWNNTFIKVQYRADSNRFFVYPYTGAIYPKDRMHQFKRVL